MPTTIGVIVTEGTKNKADVFLNFLAKSIEIITRPILPEIAIKIIFKNKIGESLIGSSRKKIIRWTYMQVNISAMTLNINL
jgi:predicted ATP-grasp superfamily ATP-dependent carboligase